MNDTNASGNCPRTCWIAAIVIGVLVALFLMISRDWGFISSVLIGVILAIIGGLLFGRIFCVEGSVQTSGAHGSSSDSTVVPTGSASAPAAAPSQAPSSGPEPAAKAAPKAAPKSEPEAAPAPVSTPAAAPDSAPDSAPASAAVQPSTTLEGQQELADRKGSWRYQDDANDASEPLTDATPAPVSEPDLELDVEVVVAQPEGLAAARAEGADDLKMIKGVGPKLEKLLNSMGYFHFDQIANWNRGDVAWVDENLKGFKGRVTRDNWVAQARQLAAGEETDFAKRAKKDGIYK